ncbi:MAG: tRNA pseudouridine(13) synthase TruD [Deltaproteobacteria bacterium]|nr:tRNA pseudouridine(13) synthase TruD [Deltaproteobacteria bacterium]
MVRKRKLEPIEFPHMLEDLPAVKGKVKARWEDFVVEEIPETAPSGEGPYIRILVEKRGWDMETLIRHLATQLEIDDTQVGYAGLKDKQAVTRQWFSVPADCRDRLERVDSPSTKLLESHADDVFLKPGHLSGNRFVIRLRGAPVESLDVARTALERLARDGLANVYGNQRFGKDLQAVETGRSVVLGEKELTGLSRLKRRFVISAFQSFLFNAYAAARIERGLLRRVLTGDVLRDIPSDTLLIAGARWRAVDVDGKRLAVTGPVYGRGLMWGEGRVRELELDVLSRYGIAPSAFDEFQAIGWGSRRNLLVFPEECSVSPDPDGILLAFQLPKGCFATTVLREIVKREL